ncbi:hypothetical protein BY458DRAFT_445564 [Sporodiniella umbellata]|nr:hypothetical protein BY458DRAFT_445564 [Sporodiniella umbellata]
MGQSVSVLNGVLFYLSCAFFHPIWFFYRAAYMATVVSYGIVLYNSYKPFHSGFPFKRMLLDENMQYIILAFYFLISKQKLERWAYCLLVTLLPFLVYSGFHVSEYLETELIPVWMPDQTAVQSQLGEFRKKYYDHVMTLTSRFELWITLPYLSLSLLTFRTSMTCMLVYLHFIRMRYFMSFYTRQEIDRLVGQSDAFILSDTRVPTVARAYYQKLKTALSIKSSTSPVKDK